MPWGLTPAHLIIILVIVLIVVGPGKLPDTGAAIGRALRGFKDAMETGETNPSASQQAAPPTQPVQPQATFQGPAQYPPAQYPPAQYPPAQAQPYVPQPQPAQYPPAQAQPYVPQPQPAQYPPAQAQPYVPQPYPTPMAPVEPPKVEPPR
ncbi:MAG: twin-arginine translocase TatA/TatE family subunit [Candidatus Limnocylindrales bacterium]|jgi:TatA/E family protein of Tat protein translocase